jgi:hypothetical protein
VGLGLVFEMLWGLCCCLFCCACVVLMCTCIGAYIVGAVCTLWNLYAGCVVCGCWCRVLLGVADEAAHEKAA